MGQTCHGHSVSCSDWTHTVTRDLMTMVSDGHLGWRQDDGQGDHGVACLTGLEVHPAPVQPRVIALDVLNDQLCRMRTDHQPGSGSKPPRFLL